MLASQVVDPFALEQFAEYAVSDAMVRNPVSPTRRIRAVLFDVDGTLYRQRPLRLLMAAELCALAFRHPRGASFRSGRLFRANPADSEIFND